MASVYIARETASTGLCRTVALKLMHEHLRRNERFKRRFLDEARVLTQVTHPYVCRVLGFGEEEGRPFIAMEYLIGEPLSRVLRALKRRVSLVSVAERARLFGRVLADIAEGIHAAHESCDPRGRPLGVVHRDLSPQNLFLLYDGTVRILDFGIARYRDRYVKTAAPGRLIGKLPYMAPEQLQGAPYDRRVDIWALGIVLWELVTLDRLFRRDTELRTMEAVCSGPIPKASELVEGLPPGLDQILGRALERDPDKRYATAREMSEDLELWLARTGDPVTHATLSEFLNGFFPGSQTERRRWAEQATPESGLHFSPDFEIEMEGADFADDSTPSLTFPKQVPRDDELVTTEHTPTVSYRPRPGSFNPGLPPIREGQAVARTIPSFAPPALSSVPPSTRTSYAPPALPPFTTISLPPLPSAPLPNLSHKGTKWALHFAERWKRPRRDPLSRSSAPETLAAAVALSMRANSIMSPTRRSLRRVGSAAVPLAALTFAMFLGVLRLDSRDESTLANAQLDAPAQAAAPMAVDQSTMTVDQSTMTATPASALEATPASPSPAAAVAQPEPSLAPVVRDTEPAAPLAATPQGPAEAMEAKPLQVTQEATNAPSKPQTTPKATGQVLIMSATPGVSVYLKGRLLGRTPLRVQLPVGTAHLSIQPSAKSPRSTVSTKVNAGRVNVLTLK